MDYFKSQGNWYKGNLHAHTTNSDGWVSPQNLAAIYYEDGYDFLAITDHWKLTQIEFKSQKPFLLIPGTEINGGIHDVGDFHIVGIGIKEQIKMSKQSVDFYTAQELIDMVIDAGGFAFLAHPSWNGVSCSDMMSLKKLFGVEVYNTGCDYEISRGYGDVQINDLLDRNKKINLFAVDDCHRPHYDTCKAWIKVKSQKLTQDAIIKSILKGHYYSSTGPEIYDVEQKDGFVKVTCSPAKKISLISNPRYGAAKTMANGDTITSVEFPIKKDIMTYFRIEVIDNIGRHAWTNPFWL